MTTENLKSALEYAVGNVAAYLKEQLADQKHITVLA